MTGDLHHDGSVTHWINQLKLGNSLAAQELWERYYERLIRLAQKRLAGMPLRVADEEDVVQSAFATFCGGLERGRFPLLEDRDDLWRLLVVITARKAINYVRREKSQKRGEGKVQDEGQRDGPTLEDVIGTEPSPDFAIQTAETLESLLNQLPLQSLRSLALSKLEGLTNEEAAKRLGCSMRTVERRLSKIRELLEAQTHDT